MRLLLILLYALECARVKGDFEEDIQDRILFVDGEITTVRDDYFDVDKCLLEVNENEDGEGCITSKIVLTTEMDNDLLINAKILGFAIDDFTQDLGLSVSQPFCEFLESSDFANPIKDTLGLGNANCPVPVGKYGVECSKVNLSCLADFTLPPGDYMLVLVVNDDDPDEAVMDAMIQFTIN